MKSQGLRIWSRFEEPGPQDLVPGGLGVKEMVHGLDASRRRLLVRAKLAVAVGDIGQAPEVQDLVGDDNCSSPTSSY